MGQFILNGYDSYSGCDILVTAKLNIIHNSKSPLKDKVYSLGSIQTISVSTHQDKKPVRVLGNANPLDHTLGQRTVAGSLVFAVFNKHFATEMFEDLKAITGKTFLLPDELPGLDITISFSNEYGRESRMAIYGIRIINEGQVMSINDLYTENTYQFVALALQPLTDNLDIGGSAELNPSYEITGTNPSDTNNPSVDNNNNSSSNNSNSNDNVSDTDIMLALNVTHEKLSLNDAESHTTFTLSKVVESGKINIHSRDNGRLLKSVEIVNKSQVYSSLFPGIYSAYYERDSIVLSNNVNFTIEAHSVEKSYSDNPLITKAINNNLHGYSNNLSHSEAICINKDGLTRNSMLIAPIINRKFAFNNIMPGNYSVYTKLDNSLSDSVEVCILNNALDKENLFKDYVCSNRNVLSHDYSNYEKILDNIDREDFVSSLINSKDDKDLINELLIFAIKFKNEEMAYLNKSNSNPTVSKNISNPLGSSFTFSSIIDKVNLFTKKNGKLYFDGRLTNVASVEYDGKSNSLYEVAGTMNGYIKTPSYLFYSYNYSDKHVLLNNIGSTNVLASKPLIPISDSRLNADEIKLLSAIQYKKEDIKLLHKPAITATDTSLLVDISYKHVIGDINKTLYICFSPVDESLDRTPVRKIKCSSNDNIVSIDKSLIAFSDKLDYIVWIEDENLNIISSCGYIYNNSGSEISTIDIYSKRTYLKNIIDYVSNSLQLSSTETSLLYEFDYLSCSNKDMHFALIAHILSSVNESKIASLSYNVLKHMFKDFTVNQSLYKKAIYSNSNVSFDNTSGDYVVIEFDDSDYNVKIVKDSSVNIDTNNMTFVYKINNSNYNVKSGFIMTYKDIVANYLIDKVVV